MTQIAQLDARLAQDTTTQRSLFSGKVIGVPKIVLTLGANAAGTANFAIFEDDQKVINKNVTGGQDASYTATKAGSVLAFYVNYYDKPDLPQVIASFPS